MKPQQRKTHLAPRKTCLGGNNFHGLEQNCAEQQPEGEMAMTGKRPRRDGLDDQPRYSMSTAIAGTFDLYADIGPLVRAARALLGVSQKDLAERADVSVATISRLESGRSISRLSRDCFRMIITVLEAEGIEFRRPGRDTGGKWGVLRGPHDDTIYHGDPDVPLAALATKKLVFPSDQAHFRASPQLSQDKPRS